MQGAAGAGGRGGAGRPRRPDQCCYGLDQSARIGGGAGKRPARPPSGLFPPNAAAAGRASPAPAATAHSSAATRSVLLRAMSISRLGRPDGMWGLAKVGGPWRAFPARSRRPRSQEDRGGAGAISATCAGWPPGALAVARLAPAVHCSPAVRRARLPPCPVCPARAQNVVSAGRAQLSLSPPATCSQRRCIRRNTAEAPTTQRWGAAKGWLAGRTCLALRLCKQPVGAALGAGRAS